MIFKVSDMGFELRIYSLSLRQFIMQEDAEDIEKL